MKDQRKTKPATILLLLLLSLLLGACSALHQDRHAHGPYWSPDGQRVLFTIIDIYKDNLEVTGRHICVLDLAGDSGRIWLRDAVTNGGWDEVQWSPDGQRLAFSSGPGVAKDVNMFVLDVKTRKVSRLTRLEGISLSPEWSPDGSRLAFIRHEAEWQKEDYMPASGVTAIYIVNADGSEMRELVRVQDDENVDFDLERPWSPDGKKLVFNIDENKGNKLFVADVDTGQITALTDHSGWYEGDYAWSPDGRRIAFTSKPDREGNDAIYVVDADGRNLRHVMDIGDNFEPIYWAPDSARFAFFFRRSDGEFVAYVATIDGSEVFQLTDLDPSGRLSDLAWSPDGRRIAAEYNDNTPLYVVDVATSDSRQVSPPAGFYLSSAKWSPDGQWIAVDANAENEQGVFLVNPGNGEVTSVMTLPNLVGVLTWLPDGKQLAFVKYPNGEAPMIYIVGLDGGILRKIPVDCEWPND